MGTVSKLKTAKKLPSGSFQSAVEDVLCLEGPQMTGFAIFTWYDTGAVVQAASSGALPVLEDILRRTLHGEDD